MFASGVASGARRVAVAALDLVLPPQCLTCDAPVDAPGRFCPDCFRRTGFVTDPCCAQCGVPFAYAFQGGADGVCDGCREHPPEFDRVRAALRYDAQARRVMLPFKHGDRVDLAGALAAQMARAGAGLLRDAEILVPVPLHRARLFARRYNQAALLALALSRLSGRPAAPDALLRTRRTESLGHKGAAARAEAVAGVFALRPGREGVIAGRRVLLIDDVMTSGATASSCAAALRRGGAASVDVLVAARVPDSKLDGVAG